MENKYIYRAKCIWANFCRFVLALVFIFSGFIKANDPLGMCYKLEEYFQAFGLWNYLPSFFPLFSAVLLGVVEFTLGVFLFFGIRRKLTTISILLFLSFMTLFTLYLAIANPVSDCGCFGDAIVMTNWETFGKNILFLIAAVSSFRWSHLLISIISKKSQWLISFYAILYISVISLYCLSYLPIFDFRPYRIGVNIWDDMHVPEGKKAPVYDYLFVMEKDGEQREFLENDYPEDVTWTLVDTKAVLKEEGYKPPITDFVLHDTDTGEDITERILGEPGYTFLLIANNLERADDGYMDLINEIYDYSMENGYAFYCLTYSSDEEIERWRERTGAEYPYCGADDTMLRTMIRSNPGLMLIKGGTVVNKWSCRNLPDEYDLTDRLENLPLSEIHPQVIQNKLLGVVAWFAVPLILFTLLDKALSGRYKKQKIDKH